MEFGRYPIPVSDVDYREVARIMHVNVDILKKELTEHVDKEIARFFDETGIEED